MLCSLAFERLVSTLKLLTLEVVVSSPTDYVDQQTTKINPKDIKDEGLTYCGWVWIQPKVMIECLSCVSNN